MFQCAIGLEEMKSGEPLAYLMHLRGTWPALWVGPDMQDWNAAVQDLAPLCVNCNNNASSTKKRKIGK